MSKKKIKFDSEGYYLRPYPQAAYNEIQKKQGTEAAEARKRQWENRQAAENEKLLAKRDAESKLRQRAVEQIKALGVDAHFSQLDCPGLPPAQAKQVIRNCCRQGLGTEHEVSLQSGEVITFLMRTDRKPNNVFDR